MKRSQIILFVSSIISFGVSYYFAASVTWSTLGLSDLDFGIPPWIVLGLLGSSMIYESWIRTEAAEHIVDKDNDASPTVIDESEIPSVGLTREPGAESSDKKRIKGLSFFL
jgi:hypothetical protein